MDDEDPFAWISANCHVSSSQEVMLGNLPFVFPNLALDSDRMSPEDHEAEETVVMVSVSESSAEESSQEEYRTPPERHSHSLTSSNEAKIGIWEDGVVYGGQEDIEKTVDLSRDSDVYGSECERTGGGECLPKATEGWGTENCVEDAKMEVDGLGEVTGGVEGRHKGTEADGAGEKCAQNNAMEEDLMMEEPGVPSSFCRGTTKNLEVVVDHGSSVKVETMRICLGEGKVNALHCNGKDVVEEVESIRCIATCICVSNNASLKVRKLPSSFCSGSKGDGAIGNDGGSCRVRTDKENGGAETSQGGSRAGNFRGNSSAGAQKGVNEQGSGGADDGSGKKPSETSEKEEPNEDEQTENIMKVLGLLAKPLRPVYKEKVEIIGSAIKAGITFPRPSWWPEDSDDDSN